MDRVAEDLSCLDRDPGEGRGGWDRVSFVGQFWKGEGTIIRLRQERKKSFQTATVGNAQVCQKGISWKHNLSLTALNNTKGPCLQKKKKNPVNFTETVRAVADELTGFYHRPKSQASLLFCP